MPLWFLAAADLAAAIFISGNIIMPTFVLTGIIVVRIMVWKMQNPFDSLPGKVVPVMLICAAIVSAYPAMAGFLFNAAFLFHLLLMLGYWRMLRNLPWLQTTNMISGAMISSVCLVLAGDNNIRITCASLIALSSITSTWLLPYLLRSGTKMRHPPVLPLILAIFAAFCIGYTSGPPLVLLSTKSTQDAEKENAGQGMNQFLPRNISGATVGLEAPINKDARNYATAFLKIIPPDLSKLRSFYLRNAGYSEFDGKKWTFSSWFKNEISDMDDGKRDGWTRIVPTAHAAEIPYAVFLPDFNNSWVPVLPDSTAVKLPALTVGENSSLTVKSLRGGYVSYQAMVAISGIQLPDIEGLGEPEDPDSLPYFYSHLPEGNFAERIRTLAKKTVGKETDPEEKLYKIMRFFKEEFKYELPAPGEKSSGLEDFMFKSRKGHCTLFATAFAMMLRAEKIPVRLAFGYCGGAYDIQNDVFVFYKNNSHAWTEVCFKGKRWKIIDVTPVAEQDTGIAASSEFGESAELFKELEPAMTTRSMDLAISKYENLKKMLSNSVPLILLAIFLWGISAYFTIRKGSSGNSSIDLARKAEEKELQFFKAFCRHFATKNKVVKRRSQTAREFLQNLKSQGILRDEFDDLVAYYYRIRYEGEAPASETEDSFIRRIAKLDETPPTA